jgi:RNA polymerase sigma-70 factor, ECF subfamily
MSAEMDFERVVELYHAALYRFAFSLARNEEDARDLTQQTFYIWARKGHQLLDQNKVKSWLFTTMHREFLGRQRKKSRFQEVELNECQQEQAEAAPFPFARTDRPAIFEALGRIEQPYQAAVALFYLEDYTYQEIATILDVPLGTVKSRISRGIAQLQMMLGPAERVSIGKDRSD